MERQFFSGNSVEQAILAAARHHGLDPSRVAFKLRDKKHGYVNVRRRVVIEVDPEAPEKIDATEELALKDTSLASGTRNVAKSVNRSSDQRTSWCGEETEWERSGYPDQEIAAIEHALAVIAGLLDSSFDVDSRRNDDAFEVEVAEEGCQVLIENDGRALYAIEHLLPRMLRNLVGSSLFCKVDSNGFRGSREVQLSEVAQRAAERAKRLSEEEILEPMNPADRRLVHMALADDEAVRTESEGQGFMKRVRIIPNSV